MKPFPRLQASVDHAGAMTGFGVGVAAMVLTRGLAMLGAELLMVVTWLWGGVIADKLGSDERRKEGNEAAVWKRSNDP
jgi:hypothetical protein